MPSSSNTPFKALPSTYLTYSYNKNEPGEKTKETLMERSTLTWNVMLEAILTTKEYKALAEQQGEKEETSLTTSTPEDTIYICKCKKITEEFTLKAAMEAGASTPVPIFSITVRRWSPGERGKKNLFELGGNFGGENKEPPKDRYIHPNQSIAKAIHNNMELNFTQLRIKNLQDEEVPVWVTGKEPTPLSQYILIQINDYNDEGEPLYIFMLPDNIGTPSFIIAEAGGEPVDIEEWSNHFPFSFNVDYFKSNPRTQQEEMYERMRTIVITGDDKSV